MKILLDIDGVMIPARPWQAYDIATDGFGMFSKISVENLNKIIDKCNNPEIILTTSHKHNFTINQWSEIFKNRGVKVATLSRLATDSLNNTRKEEIQTWYLNNQNTPFIILDDDKTLNSFDLNFKNDYLVLTNSSVGLNSISAEEAINKIELLQKELAD